MTDAQNASPKPWWASKELQGLLVVSILSILVELLIIRWLSTEMRIFAYFKNLPLMSAFLGLSLGFLWVDRKDFFNISSFLFMFLCGLLILALPLHLTHLSFVDPTEYLLLGVGLTQNGNANQVQIENTQLSLRNLAIMVGIFFWSTAIFVGLGQRTGKFFRQLNALTAYSVNVFGGLIGTLIFAVLCYLYTGPGVWLFVAGVLYFFVDRRSAAIGIVAVALLYGFLLGPYIAKTYYGPDHVKTVWSPYYRIDVVTGRVPKDRQCAGAVWGYNLQINYDTFQDLIDCSPESLKQFPPNVQESMLACFSSAFRLLDHPPENVLVLGSGNGSDVAAALRAGAKHVDAVEIDPGIIKIAKELHREHPYDSPKVTLYVGDARTFLQTTNQKYDVILFATLDSHAAFSSLSSLRMDNYIFTQEALNKAAKCLSDRGIILVNFIWSKPWLFDRHANTLARATGMVPLGYSQYALAMFQRFQAGTLYAGPGLKDVLSPGVGLKAMPVVLDEKLLVATDDFPFLFLPKREVPLLYALPMGLILLLSTGLLATQVKSGLGKGLNWQMFFLGSAFMLLEVRAIATMSLFFGSTWMVNTVVIAGVMLMILIANLAATRLKVGSIKLVIPLLIVLVISGSIVSPSELAGMGTIGGQLTGASLFVAPLMLAAIIFGLLFKNTKDTTTALSFNLIGGVLGVSLEYLSMWLGVASLGWIVSVLYLVVLALSLLSKQSSNSDAVQSATEGGA